jgi:hypothetical protein
MVEKNSGVPLIVATPLQQVEQGDIAPEVEITPQVKRSRKSKIKQDVDSDTVPNKDPVNAENSTVPANVVAAGSDVHDVAFAVEPSEPVAADAVENKVEVIPDPKRKYKRPRPLPAIEHKRVVHYYREARSVKGKDRRGGDGSRNRDAEKEKRSKHGDRRIDDDDDDDDELLSDSDWDVDSGDGIDPSDNDSKSGDDSDDGERVAKSNKRAVEKQESSKGLSRDDGGRFAPVHTVMQYKIV